MNCSSDINFDDNNDLIFGGVDGNEAVFKPCHGCTVTFDVAITS